MAIAFGRTQIIGRSQGRSAVACAAYRAGEALRDERYAKVQHYEDRSGVLASGVMLPPNAPVWMRDRERLWNAVERREDRSTHPNTAQLAREIVIALPHELEDEARHFLLKNILKEAATRQGMVADYAIHAPDPDGDDRNYHAHVMLTMRRIDLNDPDGFGNKARPWNTRQALADFKGHIERETNRMLKRYGIGEQITFVLEEDRESTHHLGLGATALERQGVKTEIGEQNCAIQARNDTRAALRRELDEANGEIEQLLADISRTRAVFDERDLAKALFKHDIDPDARYRILADDQVVRLQGENGQTLFTTAAVRDQEQAALDAARRLRGEGREGFSSALLDKALRRYHERGCPLDAEQEHAVRHALDHRLAVIQGRAGTGKSFTLNALREVFEAEGHEVIGLAPTNTAAKDLREAGFGDARTVHSFLYSHRKAQERGGALDFTPRVLVLDEAAMIDTKRLREVLEAAESLNARVVLAGDERQLASVEAGGMFGVFAQEFGAAELRRVYRQREDWQREATRAFARGDTAAGMQAYAEQGAMTWRETRAEASAELVRQWVEVRDRSGAENAFVFAHSNASVEQLNAALQTEQIKAGLVRNTQWFGTERGRLRVGEGDRLQFRANDKPGGVYNGTLGTVETIQGNRIAVRLDTGGTYTIDTQTYRDFQLGYAGTVYRGQGKTIDHAFVLYSPGMDKKTAYVAMTRARAQTRVYVAREDAPDLKAMVQKIESRQHYGASLHYAVQPEPQVSPIAERARQEQERLERARIRTEQLRELKRQRERERGRDLER